MAARSRAFRYLFSIPVLGPHNPEVTKVTSVWADPRSLATTDGISIDVFSWRYLDVSVPSVRLAHLWIQCAMTGLQSLPGFPIRISPDQCLFSGSPKLFAAYHVLHRLLMPGHPPYALISLTIKKLLNVSIDPCTFSLGAVCRPIDLSINQHRTACVCIV